MTSIMILGNTDTHLIDDPLATLDSHSVVVLVCSDGMQSDCYMS